ncbi:hypothetical protein [Micromonospora inyonensis]|uniref:Uncharacterized protein n=1 Tax=Micromonospora inyonensis TaxID=47866 RepID=A0A1C6RG41_9ACTN|nr:hypothetical protein [Micromonospora inyonensis]SCL16137.1 hypothetical protein GA0074694_1507 [Micromonospora inyonensis]
MAEPARKVARQAEERFDRVARMVRERFDAITGSRFAGRPGPAVERRDADGGDETGPDRTAPPPGPRRKGRKRGGRA